MKKKNEYDLSTDWYCYITPKKETREDYMVEILSLLLNYYFEEYKKLRRYINEK